MTTKKFFKKLCLLGTMSFALTAGLYAESLPKANPYLSAPVYGLTHFDPAQTDSVPYAVKSGTYNIDLNKLKNVTGGPVNIITLASTNQNYMWGVSSQGVTYIDISNGNFKEAARLNAPGIKVITPEIHKQVLSKKYKTAKEVEDATANIYGLTTTRIFNGIYSVVDNNNVVYADYVDGSDPVIYAFALKDSSNPSKGIEIIGTLNLKNVLKQGETLAGVSLTYDGKLIIVGNRSISVTDRSLKGALQTVRFGDDEYISNSVAVDEKNGIYVASDKYMRKVVWTGTKLSTDEKDGAWSTLYDTGIEPPTVKVGKGTGSTPTLMGFGNDEDKLVVITDGANRMNLVAFWRDGIPANFKQKPGTKSNRIADQIKVTAGLPESTEFIQTEQSVVVKDYGAFVVNNIGQPGPKDKLAGVIALGPVTTPPVGAERFEWDPKADKWTSVWTRNDVSSTSMVPAVSTKSNIVFINGYSAKAGWEVTGMDWNTGKTVHRTVFGYNNYGNGAYAIIQFFPNGDMLFNSIAGPFRIKYNK